MGHIWRRLRLGDVKCFHKDAEGFLWFKNRLVVPKDFDLRHKIMEEAHCSRYSIHPRTNKCTKTWGTNSGGQAWNDKLLSMWLSATQVVESRRTIWEPPGTCSLWVSPNGNGRTSACISSWVYPAPRVGMTRYGLLWTVWWSRLTSYLLAQGIGLGNMQSYILPT
jgi:hypothetical protein